MDFGVNILTYVLDDEKAIIKSIKGLFEADAVKNYKLFDNPELFLKEPLEQVHICVLDHILKGYDRTGLEIMIEVLKRNPACYVIAISAQMRMDVVIQYINHGVYKYISKLDPHFTEDLVLFIKKAAAEVIRDYNFYYGLIKRQEKIEQTLRSYDEKKLNVEKSRANET